MLLYVKQNHYEFGNTSSKLLAHTLKPRKNKNKIGTIEHNNTYIHNTEQIAEQFAKYFEKIYSSDKPLGGKIENYLQKLNSIEFKNEHKDILNRPIESKETEERINKLKNGKSPGIDGYGPEFYKQFKDLLLPHI